MLIRWTGGDLCRHFKLRLDEEWFLLKLTFWSLFYNHLTSWSTIFDAALEPMFWFVDHFVRYLGPVSGELCTTSVKQQFVHECSICLKWHGHRYWISNIFKLDPVMLRWRVSVLVFRVLFTSFDSLAMVPFCMWCHWSHRLHLLSKNDGIFTLV